MNYDWLPSVCSGIRDNLVDVYWILIVPLTLFLIILEFFKLPEDQPNVPRVIKRAFISIVLMVSFYLVSDLITMVGDGIASYVSPKPYIHEVLETQWSFIKEHEASWLQVKETTIWVLGLFSFIFAYLGAFMADALFQFCWAILFTLSPLMILAYIPQATANITQGLYRGLCTIMVWKILWLILGHILLKLTTNSHIGEVSSYNVITLVIINLFIGLSMMLIPLVTKSFLSGDFSATATGFAIPPLLGAKAAVLSQAQKGAGFAFGKARSGLGVASGHFGQSLGRNFGQVMQFSRGKGGRVWGSQVSGTTGGSRLSSEEPLSENHLGASRNEAHPETWTNRNKESNRSKGLGENFSDGDFQHCFSSDELFSDKFSNIDSSSSQSLDPNLQKPDSSHSHHKGGGKT